MVYHPFLHGAMTADWDLPAHPSFFWSPAKPRFVSRWTQPWPGTRSEKGRRAVAGAAWIRRIRRIRIPWVDKGPGREACGSMMWKIWMFNEHLWLYGIILGLYYIRIICSMCYVQCNHLIWLYDHYWHLIHLISSHVPQPGRTFALRATWPLLRSCLVAVRRTAKPHNNRFRESRVELHLDLSNCYWANNLKNLEHPLSSLIELFFTGSGWAWTLLRMRVWKWKWLRSPVTQGLTM